MGAIKDIVDLCIQLRDEFRDSRVAEVVQKIQSLTLSLQSSHAKIVEKNIQLKEENFKLKRKIVRLKENHAKEMKQAEIKCSQTLSSLQQLHQQNIANLMIKNHPSRN